MVARVQLNKWTINTHAALPSLHYVCSRRVAKLNDERVFLLCRKQFSNSFAVARYTLLNEGWVFTFTIENFRRSANCRNRHPPIANVLQREIETGGGGVVPPPMKHQHNGRRGVCKSLGVIIVSVQRKRAVPIPGI